jgi:rfaE bifunctional protein nucleotidyltransferase chain/domain
MNNIDIVGEKIFSRYSTFSATLKRWKKSGDIIVFTNGCFDLVHRGHIGYLAKAADLGDRLIVGLNSDNSVARLKGSGRPLIDEESRAFLLASLFFVDAVVIFSEDSPEMLISEILPDYLVKGNDYTVPEIAGHEAVLAHGGKVETIALLPGFSTSGIINKIRNNLR